MHRHGRPRASRDERGACGRIEDRIAGVI